MANIYNDIVLFFKENEFSFIAYGDDKLPALKLPREILESEKQFEKTLRLLINKGIELYQKDIAY